MLNILPIPNLSNSAANDTISRLFSRFKSARGDFQKNKIRFEACVLGREIVNGTLILTDTGLEAV